MSMGIKMNRPLIILVVLGLIAPSLAAAHGIPQMRVNCDRGQSVQSVLDRLTGPATIVVTGTCTENLVIKLNDVTLRGGAYKAYDANQSTIRVLGAQRVLITGVNVTGGRIGITATDNSAIALTNSTITNNTTGVLVTRSSSARIGQDFDGVAGQIKNMITENSSSGVSVSRGSYALIDNNTIDSNSGAGINLDAASATVTNNTIQGNKRQGIVVSNVGNARIGITEATQPGPNTITNNNFEGIQITNGGSASIFANIIQNNGLSTHRPGVGIYEATGQLLGDNTIQGSGGHGVQVSLGTLFNGAGDWPLTPGPDLITANGYSGISGWNGAHLDIRHVTVTGNTENGIVLSLQSTLRIYASTVSGNHLNGILLYDGSSVARYGTDSPRDSITGNLGWGIICYGGSNLIGDTSGVDGNTVGEVKCPPINIP